MSNRIIALSTAVICTTACLAPSAMAKDNLLQSMVPQTTMPEIDYDWLAVDDDKREIDNEPFRFAVPNDTFITPGNEGHWDRDSNGRLRWRMQINAAGAPHINLGFEHCTLPDGAEVTIEGMQWQSFVGPFTSADVAEGELWTPPVHDDRILVTITCDDEDQLFLQQEVAITKVNVGYRGFELLGARGSSESCNVDVACPEADEWRNEIPSVGVYTLNGFLTCSGAMINNTDQDETPYFLTADHCGISTGNDQSMVVIWNYENSYCRVPGSNDSGGNGNGSTNQYTTGALYLTGSSQTDFTLVRLNSSPPDSYEISFSGWSRSAGTPTIGAGIHHPATAEKRISFPDTVYASGGGGLSLWGVNWGLGRTAPGSSGSPLYNANHQIVGALCCGASFCTNDSDDYYGRSLSGSWNLLSQYLDPSGSGVTTLNTFNPYGQGNNGGVCCYQEQCFDIPEATCSNVGGTWNADVNCAQVSCIEPDPTGACCYNGNCVIQTEANCVGTYLGDDSNCSGNPCGGGSGDDAFIGLSYTIVGANLVDDAESTWTVDVHAHLAEDCRLDAVAGDVNQDKMISTTGSFYQNTFGGPTSQAINPALFSAFPDLRYDSFVTVGRTDQTDNALSDIGISFDAFEAGGAIDSSDGSWYVTPVDAQGDSVAFSNEDCEDSNGVLIARLTVRGASASVYVEALFQGKDEAGSTWQAAGSISIVNDDCNVQCVGDYTGDGVTNVGDLLAVIAGWGNPYDVGDLLGVIADWNCGTP